MMETITNCLNKAECDPSISAILLKNNGDHFCSGIDYSELIDCKDKQAYKAKANELCSAIRYVAYQFWSILWPLLEVGIYPDFFSRGLFTNRFLKSF